jgi:ribose 5-phosphate isomerase
MVLLLRLVLITAASTTRTGEFIHVVVVVAGQTVDIYVDGVDETDDDAIDSTL